MGPMSLIEVSVQELSVPIRQYSEPGCFPIELVAIVSMLLDELSRLIHRDPMSIREVPDFVILAACDAAAITVIHLGLVICHGVSPFRPETRLRQQGS